MKSSELASRIGITREMMRYYEKNGLIIPERNKESGYRNYSNLNGFDLLRIKDLQAHRLSVEDIRTSLHQETLENQANLLRQTENELATHIQKLQAQMLRIQRHRMFIEDSMAQDQRVVEMDAYGIYRLMLLGKGVHTSAETQRIAREWIGHMPFTEIGWSIPWPKDFSQENVLPAQIGLLAMPHCAFEQNLSMDEPVEFLLPGRSLRIMVHTEDPFSLRADKLKPLAEYAQFHQYQIISDISGRYSGFDFQNAKKRYFFSARVTVRRIRGVTKP